MAADGLPRLDGVIGWSHGLTAAEPAPHTVIHIVPRRAGDRVALPDCSEWINDDGVLA